MLESYVLWRLAPGNGGLAETAGRGHLNEVTTGFRLAAQFPAAFGYDVEKDKQTGSLSTESIHAWSDTGASIERFGQFAANQEHSSNPTTLHVQAIRTVTSGAHSTKVIPPLTTSSTLRTILERKIQ
jgi:hypothetical protein